MGSFSVLGLLEGRPGPFFAGVSDREITLTSGLSLLPRSSDSGCRDWFAVCKTYAAVSWDFILNALATLMLTLLSFLWPNFSPQLYRRKRRQGPRNLNRLRELLNLYGKQFNLFGSYHSSSRHPYGSCKP